MTILDLNAPGYTMLQWLTILLENREFDTSAPLAAEAKEYLMNTFHLDYKSADIIIGYRADDSYFSFACSKTGMPKSRMGMMRLRPASVLQPPIR